MLIHFVLKEFQVININCICISTYVPLLIRITHIIIIHIIAIWLGFYAGLPAALVGITPYMGLNFALYETFKSNLEILDNSLNKHKLDFLSNNKI